jgi:alkanesulfonate monooxygenase SsuD/methylene tetrahydromethanopterin reductase-like flavin-dependent oxidoreductase (luciferase family)
MRPAPAPVYATRAASEEGCVKIAMTFPSMVAGAGRDALRAWCRGVDAGPFSSLACGERITYHNLEMRGVLAAAAALTSRVRIVPTLYVLPLHPAALVAKEVATLDVLSGGRVTLCVGVGGREQDYRAVGAPFAGRFGRLDAQVAELRRFWSGAAAFEGAPPIGPAPVQPGGPPIWSGAMGPKSLARAARWADAVMGFATTGDPAEAARGFAAVDAAWQQAGRSERAPRISGFWYGLGAGAEERLRSYVFDYLRVFGEPAARAMAAAQRVHSVDAFHAALDAIEAQGCDELFLVPTSADLEELERTCEAIASR